MSIDRSLLFTALSLASVSLAHAEPRAELGALVALHSGRCLAAPGGVPGVSPCDQSPALALVPLEGHYGAFLIRRTGDGACLYSNRDGRFGWYACTPAYSDQHWTWLPTSESPERGALVRAVHSADCLFSNSDGRFGRYACTPEYADQHWRFTNTMPPAPLVVAREEHPVPPRPRGLEESCQIVWSPECRSAAPKTAVCPAARADVKEGELCGIDGLTSARECTYPTGRCRCLHVPYCGGPTPTPLQQNGMRWQCRPPARPDDCPDVLPAAGSHCATPGKSCASGGCGSSTTCTCEKGAWRCTNRYWAPPP